MLNASLVRVKYIWYNVSFHVMSKREKKKEKTHLSVVYVVRDEDHYKIQNTITEEIK